ncbi:MAG: hypothetical protein ABI589_12155, partial [Burkholderiales bacterium]
AVFGESMFTTVPDGSKIALAALVALGRQHAIELIDCQQNTPHLATLGAREMRRADFALEVRKASAKPPIDWNFRPVYWNNLSASLASVVPEDLGPTVEDPPPS